ncbi:hypothetical protein JP75_18415 [Devosia riboflavina]|uniref:Uncharacterized protein n=1 Tax=Devosia riboflavina TaxID=46914 RepID=A0A087LZ20_9HYPH|nr:hypothetical protein [Devosia riboflavina]KFL29873.1 hypothetical protein JP75_18415 [Devosia riboflavina]
MTNKTPKDVESGSDADTTPVPPVGKMPPNPNDQQKPAPEETSDGEQQDDNIDDKGNKVGGGRQEQPT